MKCHLFMLCLLLPSVKFLEALGSYMITYLTCVDNLFTKFSEGQFLKGTPNF